jgi:hypothetical protein
MDVSGQSQASAALIQGKESHGTNSTDGFVGPTVGPDFLQKKKKKNPPPICHFQNLI